MTCLKAFTRSFGAKNMNIVNLVFVYGTLKKGEPNHNWLQEKENGHSRFISKGQTVTKYPLVIASKYNIPFLLQSPGKGEILKEIIKSRSGNRIPAPSGTPTQIFELVTHQDLFFQNVVGEVYEVDEKMLSNLDILEDHPDFYVREIDKVQLLSQNDDNLANCWIYFLKKFKPSLLNEECLTEYHSEGSHSKPYTPRQQRIPGYHAKTDVLLS